MGLGLTALILYVVGFPILTWALALIHRKVIVKRAEEKILRKRLSKKAPDPVGPKWWKRFRFTLGDKRQMIFALGKGGKKKKEEQAQGPGLQRRWIWWILWFAGLAVAAISLTGEWRMIFWSLLIYAFAFNFAVKSAHKVVKHQEYVVSRIYEIAQPKLGLPAQDPAGSHVTIKGWRDYTKPEGVEIDVPTNFSDSGEESFLKQFNQVFGRESAWVPDSVPPGKDADGNAIPGRPGWDYEEGKVSLRAVPPLPGRADWEAHYVLSPAIAWSFFPIALGVENGTTVTHPTTGVKENILGFDLSGQQGKAAKAAGEVMSTSIAKSPMVFIGGGTGGGKAMDINTRVAVIRKVPTTV